MSENRDSYEDLLYEKENHVVTITLNRPEVYNAFRGTTCSELVKAFGRAGYDKDVGAIVLTGAGEKAFCTGGDQSDHDGQYDGDRGVIGMPIDEVHSVIRDVPKPVVAKVRGYAIGGGNVLATLCDLTLAADTATPLPRSANTQMSVSDCSIASTESLIRDATSS